MFHFKVSALLLFIRFDEVLVQGGDKWTSGRQSVTFLERVENTLTDLCKKYSQDAWESDIDMSAEKTARMYESFFDVMEYVQEAKLEGKDYPWKKYRNPAIRSRFIQLFGESANMSMIKRIPPTYNAAVSASLESMNSIFRSVYMPDIGTDHVCVDKTKFCISENSVLHIFKNSRDNETLFHFWTQHRGSVGRAIRPIYQKMVDKQNLLSQHGGYKNSAEESLDRYEIPHVIETVDRLYEEIRPLYEQLHAYIRSGLKRIYRNEISSNGLIPAHVLGGLWADNWNGLAMDFMPFKTDEVPNITAGLIAKNYTFLKIMKEAEKFAVSIGFDPLSDKFWDKSVLVRPKNNAMDCEPYTRAFCDGKDYRIRMCCELKHSDFISAFHELGRLLSYRAQGSYIHLHRYPQNPILSEAIAGTFALFANSPTYLSKVELAQKPHSCGSGINQLFVHALDVLASLSFTYATDKWRYAVVSKQINFEDMNVEYWNYMAKYHGISPPVPRTNEDFDAPKYDVLTDTFYFKKLLSTVLLFQIHEELCNATYDGPHHLCDVSNETLAGNLLKQIMSTDAQNWRQKILKITDGRIGQFDASSLLRYFKPLMDRLKDYQPHEKIGWNEKDDLPNFYWTTSCTMALFSSIIIATCVWQLI